MPDLAPPTVFISSSNESLSLAKIYIVEHHESCWTLMVPLDTNLMEVWEWPITTRGLQWVLR